MCLPSVSRNQVGGAASRVTCSLEIVIVATQLPARDVPDYIEADHAKMTARVTRIPSLSEVPYPVQMEPNLVIEFYSR